MAETENQREWGQCHDHIYTFDAGTSPPCLACIDEKIERIRRDHRIMCLEWPDPDELDDLCDCLERIQKLQDTADGAPGNYRLESTVSAAMAAMNSERP